MSVHKCLNVNHRRANSPFRFCPSCGEVLNNSVPISICGMEKHTKEIGRGDKYCRICGERFTRQMEKVSLPKEMVSD